MEPDMSVYLTHTHEMPGVQSSWTPNVQESVQQSELSDGCSEKTILYIRARRILFFRFPKDVAVVANTERWYRKTMSMTPTKTIRKVSKERK
jgi:hypothetical protein